MLNINKRNPGKRSYRTRKNIRPSGHHSNLDIWLSRLSHISQFGLFALTIGALYYTVIPLYKTAALEESIARREAELSAMNSKLGIATASLEKIKAEIYDRNRADLIKGIISVAPYCSGLMTPPRDPDNSENAELGDHLLKIDAANCLRDRFVVSEANSILSAEDYLTLKKAIEETSNNLSKIQNKALNDMETLPERAAKDPSILAPLGPYLKKAEEFNEFVESIIPGTTNKKSKLEFALSSTRTQISMKYVESVNNEILKLWEVEWSKKD
ncbi:hypothetical protein Q1J45_19275 [Pseudomonas rhodesiae]